MANGKTDPTAKPLTTQQKNLAIEKVKKKAIFLKYFREVPIYEAAAGKAGRSADTFHLWENEDSVFSAQIEQAKADYISKNIKEVKSKEWLLERLFKNHFSPKLEVEQGVTKEVQEALDRMAKVLPPAKK